MRMARGADVAPVETAVFQVIHGTVGYRIDGSVLTLIICRAAGPVTRLFPGGADHLPPESAKIGFLSGN